MKVQVCFRAAFEHGSFAWVYVGRWMFVVGNYRPGDWACWCWNQRGYDGLYYEWCFGPFGEVNRVGDYLFDSGETTDDEQG